MRIITTLVVVLISITGWSQARLVMDGNIGITFHNGSVADPVYLVIDNPNSNAITDGGAAGGNFILSEDEGHIVKWNISANTYNNYFIPFISKTGGTTESVAVDFDMTTAGSTGGSILFSTYPTGNDNTPYPSGVSQLFLHDTPGMDNSTNVVDRFWVIDAESYATKPAISVTYSYDEDELNGVAENDLWLQAYDPSPNAWVNFGGTPNPNPTANTLGPINVSSASFFRNWTLVSETNPLPIELLDFRAECRGSNGVDLVWTTASETNNSHFTLERSEEGIIWEAFNIVQGAGNSSSELTYRATDNNPFRGLTYYRLTQTDFDGTSETFDPVVSDCEGVGFEIITAYSIEGTDQVQLVVSAGHDEVFNVELMDLGGKSLAVESQVSLLSGLNYLNLDTRNIVTGMYLIKLQSEKVLMTRKILLN